MTMGRSRNSRPKSTIGTLARGENTVGGMRHRLQQSGPIVTGHSDAEDFVAIHADGGAVIDAHGDIQDDDGREDPSLYAPIHEETAPICKDTLPPVKRSKLTSAKPARRMSSANSGAAGNLRIDSGR